MLLGRDAAKLARVEKELAAVSGTETVEVESFVCEAGLRGAELTARLGELKEVRLAGKDVALVVNNVGMTEGIFGWFGDAEEDWADERAEFEGKFLW